MKVIILLCASLGLSMAACSQSAPQTTNTKTSETYNPLSKAEAWVILEKGTERPFSGKYEDHYETGTYTCKHCDAQLFKSDSKFDAHCGWPSFDEAIDGAVKEVPDADGQRTEILCANCDGHLGHVFRGEGFTALNTRHCVNSVSLNFVSKQTEQNLDTVYFGGGCIWGVEYYLNKLDGVKSTEVGYTGGHTINPSYKEICTGKTGHAEVVMVVYDPSQISYRKLASQFFELHDFTQVNRQGPDIGTQYRTEIFYTNEDQKEVSELLIEILEEKGYKVATKVTPASAYYMAENYHQDYYDYKGTLPYCHSPKTIF